MKRTKIFEDMLASFHESGIEADRIIATVQTPGAAATGDQLLAELRTKMADVGLDMNDPHDVETGMATIMGLARWITFMVAKHVDPPENEDEFTEQVLAPIMAISAAGPTSAMKVFVAALDRAEAVSRPNGPNCCICGKEVEPWHPGSEGWGHNPWPVKEAGRACNNCNATVVIPARLRGLSERA